MPLIFELGTKRTNDALPFANGFNGCLENGSIQPAKFKPITGPERRAEFIPQEGCPAISFESTDHLSISRLPAE
jgi:hypothetical protein